MDGTKRTSCCVKKWDRHTAFTVVELLLGIGIIGLLLGILLPAVLSARQSAARIQCNNNIRQLAIAATNYCETFGTLPTLTLTSSVWVRLGPFLDTVPGFENKADHRPPSFLQCPSDFDQVGNIGGNYGVNFGTGLVSGSDGPMIGGSFSFTPANISDGMSQTSFATEFFRLKSDPTPIDRSDYRTLMFKLPLGADDARWSQEQLMNECRSLDVMNSPVVSNDRGRYWYDFGHQKDWGYTHGLTPGSNSCSYRFGRPLAWTAGSQHAAGVNSSFLDGSARLISRGIDERVWRAMGTRSGNEVIDEIE